MFDTLYAAATNPGHSWSQMECSTALCVDTVNNRVGVGTTSPQSSLDVVGSLKLGESAVCDSNSKGSIKTKEGFILGCDGTEWRGLNYDFECGKKFIDGRDSNVYNTKKLSNGYCLMVDNLRYLPSVNKISGGSTTESRYYVYGYDGNSVSTAKGTSAYINYGVLYNFFSAAYGNACPSGWRLPTDTEWQFIEASLGVTWSNLSRTGWDCPGGGTALKVGGSSGLNMRLGGYYYGAFGELNNYGYYWSATPKDSNNIWIRAVTSTSPYSTYISRVSTAVGYGLSVKCIKD